MGVSSGGGVDARQKMLKLDRVPARLSEQGTCERGAVARAIAAEAAPCGHADVDHWEREQVNQEPADCLLCRAHFEAPGQRVERRNGRIGGQDLVEVPLQEGDHLVSWPL